MASKITDAEYNELISLLKSAAQVEHALLNAYLYAACTIKSTSQEFKYINKSDGSHVLNLRRAIQFEKARNWKRTILEVCHEEMIHLHYVQCLLRALGEKPYFELPAKDKTDRNAWFIPNWVLKGVTSTKTEGNKIPVEPFSLDAVKRFIAFESADPLQDSGIFSDVNMAVYREMHNFELDLHVELALYRIEESKDKCKVRAVIKENYYNLPTTDDTGMYTTHKLQHLLKTKDKHFQSIEDLYARISELYKKADESGLIRPDLINKDLNGEIHDNPQGFLPVGPVFRTTRFQDLNKKNNKSKLPMHFKDANNIIKEILSEGEGSSSDLIQGFHDLQQNIAENGGLKKYAGILLEQLASREKIKHRSKAPKWVTNGELLRKSHLYRFIQVFMDIIHEQKFDPYFEPARKQVVNTEAMRELCEEIMSYFNANFSAMVAWLSRIYMLDFMDGDKSKRQAIEQLATWPFMSMLIRPFLEIMSFFPIDQSNLYNVYYQSKYTLKDTKRFQILMSHKESLMKFAEIDECIFNILDKTAEWSIGIIRKIEKIPNIDEFLKQMIITRVKTFKNFGEFRPQFSFREYGGFSDSTKTVNIDESVDKKYSENPQEISITSKDNRLYRRNSWLLKLSFCGFSKMQFATDPDPPTDEVGCTGTAMFHSADGDDKTLKRSVSWNPYDDKNITREVCDVPLGINVYRVTLTQVKKLEFDERNGEIESNLKEITSYNPVKMFLNLEKDGNEQQTNFLGDNHLFWVDGEPLDPFILSINDGVSQEKVAQREVFNENKSMRKMTPLQRFHTHRSPNFSDDQAGLNKRFCDRVLKYMPASYSEYFSNPTGIDVQTYFNTRSKNIFDKLFEIISNQTVKNQELVDKVVSFYHRLYSMPLNNAMYALQFQYTYSHTISGNLTYIPKNNSIFDNFASKGFHLDWSTVTDREQPNSRWYMTYSMAFGDFDALNNCCYGNLYIPVTLNKDQ